MSANQLQLTLFQHVRAVLPPHLSLVDEIAELLGISNDSAYRRIRGEKPISLEEVQKIAVRFRISFDQFLHLETGTFLFSGQLTDSKNFGFDKWLGSILQNLRFFNSFEHKHLYFLAKDLPFYVYYHLPELCAFKHFFWKKSFLLYEDMRGQKFTLEETDPSTAGTGKQILDLFNRIDSTEIWNLESINSTIRQIEFYRSAKVFREPETAQLLYDKVVELVDHLEVQAERGTKSVIHEAPRQGSGSYTLYVNDIMLGDNTYHAVLDGKRATFLNHSTISYLITHDDTFTGYMQGVLDNLMRKSMQISVTGEKERARFFNRLRDKIRLSARQ